MRSLGKILIALFFFLAACGGDEQKEEQIEQEAEESAEKAADKGLDKLNQSEEKDSTEGEEEEK